MFMDLPCRECLVGPICSELCPPIIDMKSKIIKRINLKLFSCSFCGGGTIVGHYILDPSIDVRCVRCNVSKRYNLPQILRRWEWV